jgi:thiamine pyrophosphate-dependent acetolactate synthase large subunit-like protein
MTQIKMTQIKMNCEDALQVLAHTRADDEIVVSNQMSARIWSHFSARALDFPYLSSTMGGAIPLGLGLAIARPDLWVTVLSGDGSLLMNLGCLATVAACEAGNLTIAVMENGMYEVTGGQKTAGDRCDFAAMARAAGFPTAHAVWCLSEWRALAEERRRQPGPRLYALKVDRVRSETPRLQSISVASELKRLSEYLAGLDRGPFNPANRA